MREWIRRRRKCHRFVVRGRRGVGQSDRWPVFSCDLNRLLTQARGVPDHEFKQRENGVIIVDAIGTEEIIHNVVYKNIGVCLGNFLQSCAF